MLNLAIPIGSFDQSDHDLAIMLFCQCVKRVNRLGRAFAVGLDNYAKALPVGQIGMGQRGQYDVHRQAQTIRFFGIDIQADACLRCFSRQILQNWDDILKNAVGLCQFVSGMQCGQFNGNAWINCNIAARCVLRNCIDGV